ncbi:unnamed protein product [Cuscuta campestris]|uniref:Homeobox domain-containing protein n=1 Tax=Cuscuta campestris TaxID=132261 RepID=A0A484KQP4_9ASTE|nr:unnamed protein product [Cuscuta campestris]
MWFPMDGGGGGGDDQGGEQKPALRPPPMVTTTGYWYSDHHQIPQPEICYNNTPGDMEMVGWKSFLAKAAAAPASGAPSSSKAAAGLSSGVFYTHPHQEFCNASWVDQGGNNHDDSSTSTLRCVFPCEGNERPSQGLSLSLSSANPSAIGLQPFELRAANNNPVPAMSHGIKKKMACSQWQEGEESTTHNAAGTTSDCNRNPCLDSLDLLELHKTQTKLLHMLQEVDRRYKQYCDEMKAVVSSFEAVAGDGAGKGYAALAAKAMSRHFRCLRDGIVTQLKEVKKAAAQKDRPEAAPASAAAAGTTKGETPRLKILDQALRQQKAFQQMSMMEAHPWRPQRGLPERSVSLLRAWLFEHFLHPYPSDVDKHILARQTGLSRSQVSNWFINARVRLWKPMVEEMYLEETKEQQNPLVANSSSADDTNPDSGSRRPDHRNPRTTSDDATEDRKPNNLVRVDISSIFNNNDNPGGGATGADDDRWRPISGATRVGGDHRSFAHVGFSPSPDPAWAHGNPGGSFGYGARAGGGVSLTLGLQQQGGSGMGLAGAFSPSSTATASSAAGPPPPLYYTRPDQIEDCQTVPYPLLDSEGQNLPYRNLIGAQLLRDLAG